MKQARDEIAALAMQAFVAKLTHIDPIDGEIFGRSVAYIAECSYMLADAMIAQRDKQ